MKDNEQKKENSETVSDIVEAMREAIIAIKNINDGRPHDSDGYEINDIINDALSAPPRNCDVGTLTGQQQRFRDFCEKMQHTDKACCGGCPIVYLRMKGVISNSCELAWAQMPYEAEEGAGR